MVQVQIECQDGSIVSHQFSPSANLAEVLATFDRLEEDRAHSRSPRRFSKWYGTPPTEHMGPVSSDGKPLIQVHINIRGDMIPTLELLSHETMEDTIVTSIFSHVDMPSITLEDVMGLDQSNSPQGSVKFRLKHAYQAPQLTDDEKRQAIENFKRQYSPAESHYSPSHSSQTKPTSKEDASTSLSPKASSSNTSVKRELAASKLFSHLMGQKQTSSSSSTATKAKELHPSKPVAGVEKEEEKRPQQRFPQFYYIASRQIPRSRTTVSNNCQNDSENVPLTQTSDPLEAKAMSDIDISSDNLQTRENGNGNGKGDQDQDQDQETMDEIAAMPREPLSLDDNDDAFYEITQQDLAIITQSIISMNNPTHAKKPKKAENTAIRIRFNFPVKVQVTVDALRSSEDLNSDGNAVQGEETPTETETETARYPVLGEASFSPLESPADLYAFVVDSLHPKMAAWIKSTDMYILLSFRSPFKKIIADSRSSQSTSSTDSLRSLGISGPTAVYIEIFIKGAPLQTLLTARNSTIDTNHFIS